MCTACSCYPSGKRWSHSTPCEWWQMISNKYRCYFFECPLRKDKILCAMYLAWRIYFHADFYVFVVFDQIWWSQQGRIWQCMSQCMSQIYLLFMNVFLTWGKCLYLLWQNQRRMRAIKPHPFTCSKRAIGMFILSIRIYISRLCTSCQRLSRPNALQQRPMVFWVIRIILQWLPWAPVSSN